MAAVRSLWTRPLTAVSPTTRRAARYALQLTEATDVGRTGGARRRRRQDAPAAALLPLLLPLLDRTALASRFPQLDAALDAAEAEAAVDGGDIQDALALGERDVARELKALLRLAGSGLLARLQAADAPGPVATTLTVLGHAVGLEPAALALLDYLDLHSRRMAFRALLRSHGPATARANRRRLAALLDLPLSAVHALLAPSSPLRRLGLIEVEFVISDLEDAVQPSTLLVELLAQAPETPEALLALLIEPAPPAALTLGDFPHLAGSAERLGVALANASGAGEVGVNALFYGPPGTGKTELARALAAAHGRIAYQVRASDEAEHGLGRRGRLAAYQLAQRLLARRRDVVLIFDEVEDAFPAVSEGFALFGRGQLEREKGWMNRVLEDNPVPAIWITNTTEEMDPAFLRRFLLPLAFTTPPRSVRRQMIERHFADTPVPAALRDDLARDALLTPAQFAHARRWLNLQPQGEPAATVRAAIAATRTLLHGAPGPRQRAPATVFDPAFLNLEGELAPGTLLAALERHGEGTLCLYGAPGTGKSAFAAHLAAALDRELVARPASQLVSKYVGETERNLAALFRDTDPLHCVLLLDEADSFLSERRSAEHAWERTAVNELLQQLEQYPGIFIAATNLLSQVDAAALRRFDFKLQFRPLERVQRRRLFAREVLGDADAEVPELLGRHLDRLESLTPGDFATVARQQALLGTPWTAEQYLRRLIGEYRLKTDAPLHAA